MPLVLVTGGAGFVGANLVRLLKQRGFDLRVLDDLSEGRRSYLEGVAGPVDARWASLTDVEEVDDACRGVDAVVHLAARSGIPPSIADPAEDFRVNVNGTFSLLDATRRAGVGHIVFASSGAVLAGAEPPLSEDLAPRPRSPYGSSKLYGEAVLSAFEASYGLVGVSLRFANVYGPFCAHKQSVVARFLERLLDGEPLVIEGDGAQTRDFIFVEDVAEAIVAALGQPQGGVYHLGTGKETSVMELAREASNAARVDLQIENRPGRRGDPARNVVDISRARHDLGWGPKVELADGVARTFDWLASERARLSASG
jgi:UDP-glucose 4-epimerase